MTHEYHILPRCLRWIRRFRKRRGYGVHSPFAFDFITGVIYNNEQYYAYETLRQPLLASISRGDEYDPESGLTAKDLRLLFRLTNYQAPSRIVLLGASSVVRSYIAAARPSAVIADLATSGADFGVSGACPDLLYADSPAILPLPSSSATFLPCSLPESAMIIVRGIHRDTASRTRWRQLQQSADITLSFDLGRFGVALRRPKINRQHYVVNYF